MCEEAGISSPEKEPKIAPNFIRQKNRRTILKDKFF